MQDNVSFSRGCDSVDELILCCARTLIDTPTADRIRTLVDKGVEWDLVVQHAVKHGVAPLLHIALSTIVPKRVPEIIVKRLQTFYVSNVTHNILLTDELIQLIRLFQSHGIPVIPYKGPVIAMSAYGNIGFRQFADLDILVSEWDYYHKVDMLLVEVGWQLGKEFSWEKTYTNMDSSVSLDVHMAITNKSIPFQLNFNRLWKHCMGVTIHEQEVKTFTPSDMLIIHCVQVLKDLACGMIKLGKICDIAELIRTHEKYMDWEKVVREAERIGALHMVYLGVRVARDILGAPLPMHIASKTDSLTNITSLVTHTRECLSQQSGISYSFPQYNNFQKLHAAVRERRKDRIYRKHLHLLTPNQIDIEFLEIPKKFFFLYYLLRPIRLVIKYSKYLFRAFLGNVGRQ